MSAELQIAIDKVVEETDLSGVVHVSLKGEPLYERAQGLADRAHGIAITTDWDSGCVPTGTL